MYHDFCVQPYFFFIITDHLCITCFAELTCFCIYANVFNNNAHEVLSWQPQIFYIYKPYLFFHFYDPYSVPSLTVIFAFPAIACKFLPQFMKMSVCKCRFLFLFSTM